MNLIGERARDLINEIVQFGQCNTDDPVQGSRKPATK